MKYVLLFIGLCAFTFAGLNWNIGIAAWIAPVFLLYFTKNTRRPGFLLFYLGMAASAALSKTAENLSGLFILYITTGLSHGAVNSLPYLIEKLLLNREKRFYTTLIFPSAVVITEYLLSLVLGIWGNPSVAQYYNFNLIQITSVTGVFGISFLVAWLASVINWIVKNGFETDHIKKGVGIYGIVFLVVLMYGSIRTHFFPPRSHTVKVGAIVGDTDIQQVFTTWEDEIKALSTDPDTEIPDAVYSSSAAIDMQIRKTSDALHNGARIVVWNEISLILKRPQRDSMLFRVSELCRKNGAYVLTAFLEEHSGANPRPFDNKSLLIKPDGETAWEYRKSFLSPPERLIINRGDAILPVIDTEYGRIGSAICSDIDITGYMSQTGKNRVDLLLVPAFDWEEITPYHSRMAAFTAIQFGVSLVRSNGKGVVAFYDYQGNVLTESNTFFSESKINYAELPIQSTTTAYSILGNLFVYILMLFLMLMLGLKVSNGDLLF